VPHKRYGRENLVRKKLTSCRPTSKTSFQDLQVPFGLAPRDDCRTEASKHCPRTSRLLGVTIHWESLIRLFCIFIRLIQWLPCNIRINVFTKLIEICMETPCWCPFQLVCTKWNSMVELRYKWYWVGHWVAIRRSQLHSILLVPSSNPRPRL